MLTAIETDSKKVWDRSTFSSQEEYTFTLRPDTVTELSGVLEHREPIVALRRDVLERYPQVARDAARFKAGFLEGGCGIGLVRGIDPSDYSREQQTLIYVLFSLGLGTLMVQNGRGDRLVEVRDSGRSMQAGGRYHQTREGGSLHTDSPQYERAPDYLGLLCYHPARRGGESIFVSAYALHNRLLQESPHLLKVLYEPFHIDKRGEERAGESPTTYAPAFTYDRRGLAFRYLRNYMNDGHLKMQQPLTPEQREALDAVDRLLEDESLQITMTMGAGEFQYINNHTTVHGRRAFEDHPEEARKRVLLRTWIQTTA